MVSFRQTYIATVLSIFFALFLPFPEFTLADSKIVTALFTNDLHGHLESDKSPLDLGGFARLKTMIDRIRKENPNSLLFDSGDFIEGNISYTENAGAEVLKLMDFMGYDAAVIGNHEWFNGPDTLLDTLLSVAPKTKFLSSNFNTQRYARAREFREYVKTHEIFTVANVKIAVIGLSTYEFIYDHLLAPVRVRAPFRIAHEIASYLKTSGQADVVIALSHNSVSWNGILAKYAPDIDLIIGAHDHKKLTEPYVVNRWPWGRGQSWIVEAGCWGRYLGQVDFKLDSSGRVRLLNYQLFQMDASVPEDKVTQEKIRAVKFKITDRMGPIFDQEIGETNLDLTRSGAESLIGDLVADAYLDAIHVDLALDSQKFIYGELHPGRITLADTFNVTPAIYNPKTGKAWDVKILPVSGRRLKWLLHSFFVTRYPQSFGLISVAGLQLTYDPWFHYSPDHRFGLFRLFSAVGNLFWGPSLSGVQNILIQGKPLLENKIYRVALGNGVLESIRFLNQYTSRVFDVVPLNELESTTLESWDVLAKYIQKQSSITEKNLEIGTRIRTRQPDIGVFYHQVHWNPIQKTQRGMLADIRTTITNYGGTASSRGSLTKGPRVRLMINTNGIQHSFTPVYQDLSHSIPLKALAPNESVNIEWNSVVVPQDQGLYHVTVRIEGNDADVNMTNNEVTHWFREPIGSYYEENKTF